jgi:hypothetical protein
VTGTHASFGAGDNLDATWATSAESQTVEPPLIDTSTPNIARVYDYWLGGKDNYEAD